MYLAPLAGHGDETEIGPQDAVRLSMAIDHHDPHSAAGAVAS
jgi:hypothetical protein